MFFFLLQTEQGDIFKCTLETDEEMVMVTEIRMKYFDTTPIASSMCVLKTGFLFVASEFGNQYVLIALKYIIVHVHGLCLNYQKNTSLEGLTQLGIAL